MAESCAVCDHLLRTCSRLGDKSYCKKLLDKLEKDEISEKEFDRRLNKKFGRKKFDEAWSG